MAFPLSPLSIHPMEAHIADAIPSDGDWQFEPKWDGLRSLAFRDGPRLALHGKSGKALTVYFPEIVSALSALSAKRFVVDGELVIPEGDKLSFDALQARLHPAESRRRKLAAETPALFILFDLLAHGADFTDRPLTARRARLDRLFEAKARLRLSPYTRDRKEARTWLRRAGKGALDGIIAKPLDAPYLSGERAMLKIKHHKTADCVVGGFRYAAGSHEVGSLLLGLFDSEGRLHHVGFTSGIADEARPTLTKRLEALKGGEGFSAGKPGGPSRWSTERSAEWVPIKNKLVAEVRYDHVTSGRFRHGTRFLRWRPDKPVRACTCDQLEAEARPSRLLADLLEEVR